ncbi:MAG TPA: M42 family metallopeptidase [Firmicutes bacterium]|nr:M42 family metallopeptidase [Bacillota bacterium]
MATRDLADFLAGLVSEAGVSGHEREVAEVAKAQMSGLFDEARHDALGNLILLKRGMGRAPHPRVMLAAHMDEIGLMVTKIEEEGCLRVTEVGGIDRRILPGLEVVVHGRRDLPGVVGAKPPHVQEPDERKKSVKWEDLFIDVALTADEARELVQVGDTATFATHPSRLKGQLMAGKAMDDRAGVAVMFECLKVLADARHHADVYCVATVQEEVGLRGAITSTYGIVPDIGIAVDVGHGDMLGVPEYDTLTLGKGPAIAFGPQVHPAVFARLKEIADDLDIGVQVEPSPYPGGTDAFAIQVTRGGIPSALISIPLRYMHTAVETVSLADIKKAGRLLAEFVVRLDKKFVEGLTCF